MAVHSDKTNLHSTSVLMNVKHIYQGLSYYFFFSKKISHASNLHDSDSVRVLKRPE